MTVSGKLPGMGRWTVIVVLATAQFIMVLDTTVMNVSLSAVVKDLDTTVASLQLAITMYALCMAAFMLTGGKLGDVLGRKRAFSIGLVVYGVGSMTTALSPNLTVLLIGWSLVEGLGAVLIIPAIASLTAVNYRGRDRAVAYGILGGIAAAGAAAGPLIGGWFTTELSWRYVFAGETVCTIILLLFVRRIADAPVERRPHLDPLSVVLSALGLGTLVFGILKSSSWGLLAAKSGPEIGGETVEPFGLSLVPFLIGFGLVIIGVFIRRQEHLEREGRDPLLPTRLLGVPQLRAGLSMLSAQQLILNGTFFVLPVYLQMVLGKDALETGIAILPLSIGVVLLSFGGARMATTYAPRTLLRIGLSVLLAALVVMLAAVDKKLDSGLFAVSMFLFGAGIGLGASQLGNVIMSSVPQSDSSDAGGLQGTAQNLGAALGTALIGAVLLAGLSSNFNKQIAANPAISTSTQQAVASATQQGVPAASTADVQQALAGTDIPASQQEALVKEYSDAELLALKQSLLAAMFFVLAGFWFAGRLPAQPLVAEEEPGIETVPA